MQSKCSICLQVLCYIRLMQHRCLSVLPDVGLSDANKPVCGITLLAALPPFPCHGSFPVRTLASHLKGSLSLAKHELKGRCSAPSLHNLCDSYLLTSFAVAIS